MNQEQYDRWKDFALRMARVCFDDKPEPGRPSSSDVANLVEDFFCGLDEDDMVCWVDWDDSTDYPEGHKLYRVTGEWRCRTNRGEQCPYNDCRDGVHYRYAHPYCMSDEFSEWSHDSLWHEFYNHATDLEIRWDEIHRQVFDYDGDAIRNEVFDRWRDPVACCVRAGMDCASAPSMGVVGFTAGDLRRMYPEGVPDWVKGDPNWKTVPITGVVPGIGYTMGEPHSPRSFDELPDEASVWL